jgi:hypothetical protein
VQLLFKTFYSNADAEKKWVFGGVRGVAGFIMVVLILYCKTRSMLTSNKLLFIL